MNLYSFEKLRAKYGRYASWAIWNPLDRKDVSVIDENLSDLHARTVMVGLNISAALTVPWSNFHIGRNDRKLEHAFNRGPFRGSYMTDLIKNEIEVNSGNLMGRIRRNEIDIHRHVSSFQKEIFDIGADESSQFILFGGHVSDLFRKYLGKGYPKHISVRHYAVYGSAESWAHDTLNIIEN